MSSIPEDPHKAREAERYENPIPSRELIRSFLEERNAPATHKELCWDLGLKDEESVEALRRRLFAMTRDGQLLCNRQDQYLPISKANLIKGRVIGHRDGFGFVVPETGGEDLYLSAKQMLRVFDGDVVLVRVERTDHRGKRHAKIVEVVERNTEQLVGRLYREGNIVFVEVENTRISQQVLVDHEHTGNAEHGQYVVLQILQQPSKRTHATGKVIEVLGDHMAPGMEIEVAIRSYNIPFEWPEALREQVSNLKNEVLESDKQGRVDIRHLPLVTIDGEDARDFDDAVYCQRSSDGWKLFVAIADVSHYVSPESPLDQEANKRATSVYFPDHVVPMLPEVLSNGLCSLNPLVDRLCMVCEMDISFHGEVQSSRFYEAVMHSHARLTYNQVGTILEEPDSSDGIQLCEDFSELLPELHELYGLYQALLDRRKERGAIDFETVETKIVFGDERKIDAIVPAIRNDAHKIIEECMLCANVATAEFLSRHKIPSLYRIHEGPTPEKLENVRAFLSEQGLQLMGGEEPEPGNYQELLAEVKERPDFSVLQTVLLRSMSQAVYGPEEKGHFGLAYDHYAHFTSPIRRYPDLLVHRAIKSIIYKLANHEDVLVADDADVNAKSKQYQYPYDLEKMLVLGEHCSMAERRADEATRDVMNWLKCEYLQQHLGDTFEGIISGVTGFGFFVELAELYAEGLVHVSTLEGDYYQFDMPKQRLIGERTGVRYGLGDKVTVQVSNINLDERKVDLLLVSAESRGKSKRRLTKQKETSVASKAKSDRDQSNKPRSARAKKEGTLSIKRAGSKAPSSKKSSFKKSSSNNNEKRSDKSKQSVKKPRKIKLKEKTSRQEALKSKQVKKTVSKSSASDKASSSEKADASTRASDSSSNQGIRKRKLKKS